MGVVSKRADNIELPVLQVDQDRQAGTRMGRRRAVVLVIVHVVIALHIWWFVAHGSAITPLEPSEAGHSIRTGAINAGAIFLCLLILSTLVFGRFFCGWACHVVAYQDAARWLLIKLGLRPRPVRARLLMLVPLFAVYWLFVRPLIERWNDPEPAKASLHLTTGDFWATFPGVTISILTFLVCGFVVVYFLGSKGFCTYGCPYGALFVYADKVAPGRIRVNEDCTHSGNCTRTCSSNVDVATEVATYGMVVDPGCMKCMDCVAGCPNDALRFGFGPVPAKAKRAEKRQQRGRERADRKAAKKANRAARSKRVFDYTWPEELTSIALFAGLFWVYFNLYRVVPLLMAVGLCVVLTFLLLSAAQLLYRRDLNVQGWTLRRSGKWTTAGWTFGLIGAVIVAATAHSAVVQYHTKAGLSAYEQAVAAHAAGAELERDEHSAAATQHLDAVRTWGVFETRSVRAMLGEMARWRGERERALALLQQEVDSGARSRDVRLSLGLAQLEAGRIDAAVQSIERAFDDAAPPRSRFKRLDAELDRVVRRGASDTVRGRALELRMTMLRRSIEAHPEFEEAAVQLCQLLVRPPVAELRDPAEALRVAESVSAAAGRRNATLLGMLAALRAQQGEHALAAEAAEQAAERAAALGDDELAADMRRAAEVYRRFPGGADVAEGD